MSAKTEGKKRRVAFESDDELEGGSKADDKQLKKGVDTSAARWQLDSNSTKTSKKQKRRKERHQASQEGPIDNKSDKVYHTLFLMFIAS